MDKIILRDYSRENVEKNMVNFNIEEDEYYSIREIKKPRKILFFKLKGEYEIIIAKKSEKVETKQKKAVQEKPKHKKVKEKIKKKSQAENQEKEVIETKQKETRPKSKIDMLIEEHFKLMKLDIKVVKVRKKDRFIVYYVEGSDVAQFIKNKGFKNLSKMLYYTNPKFRKKVEFVSVEEAKKTELKIRKLARNIAKKVINTKKEKDLFGLDPSKRRLIHDELSNYKNIKTESFGEKKDRYLKVSYIED